MDKFLTEACSPTENLACGESQTNAREMVSPERRTEVKAQYLNQWQSSWDAMGEAKSS